MIAGSEERRYPASAAQRRLWFIAALNPASCAYNNAHVIRLRGALDAGRLAQCLHLVVARHEALRTRFEAVEAAGGDVTAVVAPQLHVEVATFAAPHDAPNSCAAERAFVLDFARRPFDLARGPLVRAALFRHAPEHHAFVLVLHHSVSDRWSFGILQAELATLYGAPDERRSDLLAPLEFAYGDYARSELAGGAVTDGDLAYWRETLAGGPVPLNLPFDRPRPPLPTERGGVVALTLDSTSAQSIARTGAALRATPFMTLLAAFLTLLQRYGGQSDLIVGTPVAGRGRLEREAPLGVFVNTLPLRVSAAPGDTFEALLANVRTATLHLLMHQAVPLDRLVRETLAGRDPNRNPFFDVVFNFHNTPSPAAWPPELQVDIEDVDLGTARLDLSLGVRPEPDGTFACRFEYSADLFDAATIEGMAAQYRVLLEAVARDPQTTLERLPLASATERETILQTWSRAAATPGFTPHSGHAGTLHSLVERAALRTPGAVALVEDDGRACTYRELERRANRMARALRARGVARDVRVGLFLERSIRTVVAMLATLKAGGAYVPLDPAYPAERIAYMLQNAGVRVLVARAESFAALREYGIDLLDADAGDDAHGRSREAEAAPPGDVRPGDLAYVMFTSGSTGRPKAVAVEHRGVVALVCATPSLAFEARDVFLLHAALTFDASTYVWAPLAYGARVAVMPPGPFSLAEFGHALGTFGITVAEATPALFHQLVEERLDDLRGLRRWLVGGDVLSPVLAARFAAEVPACRLFNGYGPTEATVIACAYEVRPGAPARGSVPVGRPIARARAYILDRHCAPVAAGIPGELYLGGDGLARGYLNDAALTARQFLPDPFGSQAGARMYRTGDRARWLPTGEIELLGRSDGQIKLRGFRIEPAEVEFALLEHPAVRQAAVAVRGSGPERYLVGYAEVRPGGPDEAALREFLKSKLPSHALPARLVIMAELPKTSSGKLDRRKLPDPPAGGHRPDDAPPRPGAEQRLAAIVRELLGVQHLGRDDDFFALGAHSLLATRIIARIADAFGVELPLRAFFAAPTVAGLAKAIGEAPQRAPAATGAALQDRLAALSDAEIDALLAATLAEREPALRFRCALLGASTLVVRCADYLRERGHVVAAVIEAPEHARQALEDVLRPGDVDYVFSVVSITYLDASLLARVKRGALNLHDAPLPRYAGRYATTWAIAAREREHGVAWHEMTGRIDAGPIFKTRSVPIDNDTAFTLNIKCYEAAFAAFVELVAELESGTATGHAQDLSKRTYFTAARRPSPACLIDWAKTAAEIDAFVRALDFERTPNPVGRPLFFAGHNAYVCRALSALGEPAGAPAGTIVRRDPDGIVVATGDELVCLRDVAALGRTETASTAAGVSGLRAAGALRALRSLPLAEIEALESVAIRHEAHWLASLARLQPLAPAAFPSRAHGAARDAVEVDAPSADPFETVAAFCAALGRESSPPAFDVAFETPHGPAPAPELDALFATALPVRVAPAATAGELRERCAAAAEHRTFARDIFARYPLLHGRAQSFAAGTLPVTIVVAPPERFDEAGARGDITLVVEPHGGRAKLTFWRSPQARGAALQIARELSVAAGAERAARTQAAGAAG